MLIVHHRINSVSGLRALPSEDGTEIDIRTSNGVVILSHEPFELGAGLDEYLDTYGPGRRSPLICNVKEDLLEGTVVDSCRARGIDNLFFLDCAFPTLVRLANDGFTKLAIRVSEYEPVALARGLSGRVDWAWIDSFSGEPPDGELIRELQAIGYRICLVSPELQGYGTFALDRHVPLRALLRTDVDAVCTKFADRWRRA